MPRKLHSDIINAKHITVKVTHQQHRHLFLILAICFIIVAPTATLWALGYRFHWKDRAPIQIGGLYINTQDLPVGAKATIQDVGNRIFSPSILDESYFWNNVPPGNYKMEISKEGYFPWSKEINVNALQVIRFESVLLLPKSPTIELFGPLRAADFWPAGRNANSFYFSDETGKRLFLLKQNLFRRQLRPIIETSTTPYIQFQEKILNVNASPDGSTILITIAPDTIFIFQREKSQLSPLKTYLNRLGITTNEFTRFFWSETNSAELIGIAKNKIYLIDTERSFYRRALINDQLRGISETGSILLGVSGNVYHVSRNSVRKFDEVLLPHLIEDKTPLRVEALASRQYLTLDNGGNLWKVQENVLPELITQNTKAFWVNDTGTKTAILLGNKSLLIYSPKNRITKKTDRDEIIQLGYISQKPEDLFWLKNNGHLLLRFPEKIEVVEITSRLPIYRVSYPVSSTRSVWRLAKNDLFFLSENKFWTLSLP